MQQQMDLTSTKNKQTLSEYLYQVKFKLTVLPFLLALLTIFYVLKLEDVYRADALLAPASEKAGGASGLASQFGGIAAMAGIKIGGSGVDDAEFSIRVIQSRDFIAKFIEKYDLKPLLFAVKHWDKFNNEIIFDEEIYDIKQKKWTRRVDPPRKAEPSMLEATTEFQNRLAVTKDKLTSIVTITFEHQSPEVAKVWLEKLIAALNEERRLTDIEQAQRAINYINSQVNQTEIVEVKNVLYQLIEEQTKTLMLAKVKDNYAMVIVQAPVISEEKVKPARAVIVVATVVLGLMISFFFAVFNYTKNINRFKDV